MVLYQTDLMNEKFSRRNLQVENSNIILVDWGNDNSFSYTLETANT